MAKKNHIINGFRIIKFQNRRDIFGFLERAQEV